MRAVVFREGSIWSVEDVPTPDPARGQVRLRVIAAGVCGTDEHLLHGGFLARFPLIPGHEIVGEVDAIGDDVIEPALGTRVIVDSNSFCGTCASCRRGQHLYCRNIVALGCNAPGAFAEHVVVAADKCYYIGDLDPLAAVMTEPAACALHGVDVLALRAASDALILGAGPTGLIMAQMLLLGGAARVTVSAPTVRKLDLARTFGAAETVRISRTDPYASLPEFRALAPEGFDAVIEATGSPTLVELGLRLTATGGTLMVYGMAAEQATATIRPHDIFSRELTIKGSFSQAFTFERALRAVTGGRVRTEGIITDQVGLEDFGRALDNLHDSAQIKTLVRP